MENPYPEMDVRMDAGGGGDSWSGALGSSGPGSPLSYSAVERLLVDEGLQPPKAKAMAEVIYAPGVRPSYLAGEDRKGERREWKLRWERGHKPPRSGTCAGGTGRGRGRERSGVLGPRCRGARVQGCARWPRRTVVRWPRLETFCFPLTRLPRVGIVAEVLIGDLVQVLGRCNGREEGCVCVCVFGMLVSGAGAWRWRGLGWRANGERRGVGRMSENARQGASRSEASGPVPLPTHLRVEGDTAEAVAEGTPGVGRAHGCAAGGRGGVDRGRRAINLGGGSLERDWIRSRSI